MLRLFFEYFSYSSGDPSVTAKRYTANVLVTEGIEILELYLDAPKRMNRGLLLFLLPSRARGPLLRGMLDTDPRYSGLAVWVRICYCFEHQSIATALR